MLSSENMIALIQADALRKSLSHIKDNKAFKNESRRTPHVVVWSTLFKISAILAA